MGANTSIVPSETSFCGSTSDRYTPSSLIAIRKRLNCKSIDDDDDDVNGDGEEEYEWSICKCDRSGKSNNDVISEVFPFGKLDASSLMLEEMSQEDFTVPIHMHVEVVQGRCNLLSHDKSSIISNILCKFPLNSGNNNNDNNKATSNNDNNGADNKPCSEFEEWQLHVKMENSGLVTCIFLPVTNEVINTINTIEYRSFPYKIQYELFKSTLSMINSIKSVLIGEVSWWFSYTHRYNAIVILIIVSILLIGIIISHFYIVY
jgi:hypothetical protein